MKASTTQDNQPTDVKTAEQIALYLRKVRTQGSRVATVVPTSRVLAKAMCGRIDPAVPQTILELGAGTGSVTAAARNRKHPASRLITVEIDGDFVSMLHQRFKDIEIIHADAADVGGVLEQLGITRVDVVLSGLPIAGFSAATNEAMLRALDRYVFSHGGWFCQQTAMPYVFGPMYRRLFKDVSFQLVLRNLPPGGVYYCRHLKPGFEQFLPNLSAESRTTTPS